MRTAVDTTVLLDVLGADPRYGQASREALRGQYDRGALVVCDVAWAEVAASFPTSEACRRQMQLLGITFDPLTEDAAAEAGRLWRSYRRTQRGPRVRILADFLIGAHAKRQADALLTRDGGFYRRYFSGLQVIRPAG